MNAHKTLWSNTLCLVAIALVAACSTSGSTTTSDAQSGTTAGGGVTATTMISTTDIVAEVTELQTDFAAFSAEVEAQAPDSIKNAWTNLELALTDLGSAATDLTLTPDEVAPIQSAVDQVAEAVETDGDQLSAEFREFWTDFTARITALVS